MTVYVMDGVSLEDALAILRTGTAEDMRRYCSHMHCGNAHGNTKTRPAGGSPTKDGVTCQMTKQKRKKG